MERLELEKDNNININKNGNVSNNSDSITKIINTINTIGATKDEFHEDDDDINEPTSCSFGGIVTFSIGLVAGTFSALLCKAAYDTRSEGEQFAKPVMMLLLMFLGMSPAALFYLLQQLSLPATRRDSVSAHTVLVLIVPCVCDLLCTLLLLVAQLYITASVWQMLRGSVIVITALLKSHVLGVALRRHMWLGVVVIALAMVLVAATSLFRGSSDDNYDNNNNTVSGEKKDPRIGILLVLMGCLAQGVQYVFEEKVMSIGAPPLLVIGAEGLWGSLLTILIIYPLAYRVFPGTDCNNTCYEDPFHAFDMIRNNSFLTTLTISFVITVTIYNCMVIYVTKYLSAIWHAILDNFR